MSGFYDNADRRTYRFPAAAIDTAAVFGRVIGPAGKVGQVVGCEYVRTTEVTGTAAEITVDTNAGLTSPFSTTIAAAAANAGGAATAAQLKAATSVDARLPADTVVEVASDGAATAGDADVIVTIDWF